MSLHTEIEEVQDAFTITQQNQVSSSRLVGNEVQGIVWNIGIRVLWMSTNRRRNLAKHLLPEIGEVQVADPIIHQEGVSSSLSVSNEVQGIVWNIGLRVLGM